ncbi:hypothetical protein AX15_000696 [Amanita polypyramis BW_CC]|nr:hypothetical protein AX15_000696 [Amanita polypyramis BW_CC]
MHSNTGDQRVYNDGDQRPPKKINGPQRGMLARQIGHDVPPPKTKIDIEDQDERAIGDVLAMLAKKEKDPEENKRTVTDPLARAISHGNKPSRGAQIDAELMAEDQQKLREKESEKNKNRK